MYALKCVWNGLLYWISSVQLKSLRALWSSKIITSIFVSSKYKSVVYTWLVDVKPHEAILIGASIEKWHSAILIFISVWFQIFFFLFDTLLKVSSNQNKYTSNFYERVYAFQHTKKTLRQRKKSHQKPKYVDTRIVNIRYANRFMRIILLSIVPIVKRLSVIKSTEIHRFVRRRTCDNKQLFPVSNRETFVNRN